MAAAYFVNDLLQLTVDLGSISPEAVMSGEKREGHSRADFLYFHDVVGSEPDAS